MSIDFNSYLDKNVLHISGRIDSYTVSAFETALYSALEEVPSLQIDCSELSYISSACLRILAQTAKQLEPTDQILKLTHVQPAVYHILQLSGFTSFLQVSRNDDETR